MQVIRLVFTIWKKRLQKYKMEKEEFETGVEFNRKEVSFSRLKFGCGKRRIGFLLIQTYFSGKLSGKMQLWMPYPIFGPQSYNG